VDAGMALAEVTVDQTYSTPAEHNNPMEPHSSTAQWDGDRLTLYDSNQGATRVQHQVARLFGLDDSAVRVVSEHVGGGFGCKGSARPQAVLAAMAARVDARARRGPGLVRAGVGDGRAGRGMRRRPHRVAGPQRARRRTRGGSRLQQPQPRRLPA